MCQARSARSLRLMTSRTGIDFLYEPGHPPSIPAHMSVPQYRRHRGVLQPSRWTRLRAALLHPAERA